MYTEGIYLNEGEGAAGIGQSEGEGDRRDIDESRIECQYLHI